MVILEEDGQQVFACVGSYGNCNVAIEVFSLLGESLEDYRVKMTLGDDLLVAVLTVSTWDQYLELSRPGYTLGGIWKYQFTVPGMLNRGTETLEIGLDFQKKVG